MSGLFARAGTALAASCSLLVTLTLPTGTAAANWRFVPNLQLAETYSDNIALRRSGEERADFVTEISPGFTLNADGRRMDIALNYRWRGLYFTRDNEKNAVYHQLGANMGGTLINNLLYIDSSANYRQTVVAPGAAVGQGYIGGGSSLQDVFTSDVSPYLKRKFGSWGEASLRYSQSNVLYPGSSDRNSFSNSVSFRVVDQKTADRWSWSLGYITRSIDYRAAGRGSVITRQADLQVGYQLSNRLGINGQVGRDENKYPLAAGTSAPEGNFWNLGLSWQPNPRVHAAIGGGVRYYGSNWYLDLSRRGRRSTLSASYSEGMTTRRQYQREQWLDSAGRPVLDASTLQPLFILLPLDEVYLRRRAQLKISYGTRRSSTLFSLHKEWRDYQESQIAENVRGTGISWRWSPGRRASFNVGTDLILNEYSNRLTKDRRLATYVTFTRKFGRYMDASFDARNTRRRGTSSYTENLLSARLTLRW